MQFGKRKADAPDEPSGDGLYLRTFKDGDTKVRFLEETDDWIVFREHYNKERRAYPCTDDKDTCPGCNSTDDDEQRSTRKYATLLHVTKGNYVAPFRVPMSLARRMFARAERNNGVVTDRDYVIMRSGKGLETDYDVDPDDKYEVNVKALLKDAPNISEILEKMYEENAPKGERRDDSPPRRARKEDTEEFPSDSEAQGAGAGDSELVVNEDELYEMGVPQLQDLAMKMDLALDGGEKKSDLIRKILKAS